MVSEIYKFWMAGISEFQNLKDRNLKILEFENSGELKNRNSWSESAANLS